MRFIVIRTRLKIGKVEVLVHQRNGSNDSEPSALWQESYRPHWGVQSDEIPQITLNEADADDFVTQVGGTFEEAAAVIVAHEFGHALLVLLGMNVEEQGRMQKLSEWLAWELARVVLPLMAEGVEFRNDSRFRFAEVSDERFRDYRAAALRSYQVDPGDAGLAWQSLSWMSWKGVSLRELIG